ncbi:hypothetical protein EST38_g5512 [Candolleomyces aberdarensis]|uniref:BTB domain-containing protein n=1 Tax=Candolleomyces aberdarensis TaxID=2316362 RepID=A0A4Q2DMB2_9AGAR|nr:hypothetical protein EST38_g5512 [Candolleomyces aberdarensis]
MGPPTTTASPPSAEVSETPTSTRKKYYIHPVTFKVEDEIYRVPSHGLADASEVFATMFTLPQSNKGEGQSDENPIELPLCTKAEFESLLEVLYPNSEFQDPAKLSKEQWLHVLKLSTQWAMDEVRTLALSRLLAMRLPRLERIGIARKFKVTEWLLNDYPALIHSWGEIPLEELAAFFGWEMTARLSDLAAKAQLPLRVLHASATAKLWSTPGACKVQPKGRGGPAVHCTWIPKTLKHSQSIVFICSRCNRESLTDIVLEKTVPVPLYGQDLNEAIKAAFPADFD